MRVCTSAWTRLGQRLVRQRHDAGRRVALRHLAGQVRAGEDAGGDSREHLGDHLGHAQVGPDLDSLGQAHDGLDRRPPAAAWRSARSGTRARDGHEDDADALECLLERRRDHEPVGELHVREVPLVLGASRAWRRRGRANAPRAMRACEHRRWSRPPCPRTPHRSPPPGRSWHKSLRRPRNGLGVAPVHCPGVEGHRAASGAGGAMPIDRPTGSRGRPDPRQGLPPGQA